MGNQKMELKMIISTFLLFFFIKELSCKVIYVSPKGRDYSNCGSFQNQCQSLNYTLIRRARFSENITIYLDGGQAEKNSYALFNNLFWSKSLKLLKQNTSTFNPLVTAADENSKVTVNIIGDSIITNIELCVDSVDFENVIIVVKKNTHINISHCDIQTSSVEIFLQIKIYMDGMKVWFDKCRISGSGRFIYYENARHANQKRNSIAIMNSIISAGIYVSNVYVSIENTTFEGSRGEYPGPWLLECRNSAVVLHYCTFKNNIADMNVALLRSYSGSTVSVYSSKFINNTGAGILQEEKRTYGSGSSYFQSCLFESNTVSALFIDTSVNIITNCLFTSNSGAGLLQSFKINIIVLRETIIANNTFRKTMFSITGGNNERSDSFYIDASLVKNNQAANIIEIIGLSHVSLSHTEFSMNKIVQDGIHMRFPITFFKMTNISFNQNIFGRYIISTLGAQVNFDVKIVNCTFSHNRAKSTIESTQDGKLEITSTNYFRNIFSGTMFNIVRSKEFLIEKNIVKNNTLQTILDAASSNVIVRSTIFAQNIVSKEGFIVVQGSMNFINNTLTNNQMKGDVIDCWKTNTVLKNNTVRENRFKSFISLVKSISSISCFTLCKNVADGLGKFVYFDEEGDKNTKLHLSDIVNSGFKSVYLENSNNPILHIRIKNGILEMKNVSIHLTGEYSTGIASAIYLSLDKNQPGNTHPEAFVQCPKNYNPISSTTTSSRFFEYELSCQACRRGLYNVRRGSETINELITEVTVEDKFIGGKTITTKKTIMHQINKTSSIVNQCHLCPAGGDCTNQIKSRDNFYGYVDDEFKVNFVTCPDNYCCSVRGRKCTSYNTCNFNRSGVLCGSCTKGYYVNFFSNHCVLSSKCTGQLRLLFWFIYLSSAIIVSLLLCFTKDIIAFCKATGAKLWMKISPRCFRKTTSSNCVETALQIITPTIEASHQSKGVQTVKVEPDLPLAAIFNILVGFYQLRALITIQLNDEISSTSFVSTFFNLEIVTNKMDSICPTPTMTAVYRDFLKGYAMVAVMLLTILVSLLVVKVVKLVKQLASLQTSENSNATLSIAQTFSIGYFVIMSFSYKNLSKLAFTFVHCVPIDNSSVLYISGDTKCYTSWQIVNFLFLILWVVPFPLAATAAYNLHKQKCINTQMFMICLTVPVATPFLRLIKKKLKYCEEKEKLARERLFETFEAPYSVNMFWWESWRLYERFILSGITTFFTNPAIRLSILTPIIVVFLLLHHYVNPYKKSLKMISSLDLSSYVCLCLLLVINMFRAVVYVHSIPLQYPVDLIFNLTNYLEEIFSPLWLLFMYLLVRSIGKALAKRNEKARPRFTYMQVGK